MIQQTGLERKKPIDGYIPFPEMNHQYGQIPVIMEQTWKRGLLRKITLFVPRMVNGNPVRDEYEIECNSPQFLFKDMLNDKYDPYISSHYCKEHKCVAYSFYVPLCTRKIVTTEMFSSVFISFKYILGEPTTQEREILSYMSKKAI